MQHQTDIKEYGHLFSYAVIYACNALGICLWIVLVSSATLDQMGGLLKMHTVQTCEICAKGTGDAVRAVARRWGENEKKE